MNIHDDVTRTPMQECPHCGYKIDAHGPLLGGHRAPGQGDFSVCLACARISRYSATLKMIPASIDDPDIDAEDRAELWKAISGIEHLRRRIPDWPQKFRRRSRG
jgi:hypothetical protein